MSVFLSVCLSCLCLHLFPLLCCSSVPLNSILILGMQEMETGLAPNLLKYGMALGY